MSYILDALRKSEAQRQAGRIPNAVAPQGVAIEPARSNRFRLLGWIVLVLLVALAVGWLARRYSDGRSADASIPPEAGTHAAASASVARSDVASPVPLEPPKASEVIPRLKLASSLPLREAPPASPSSESSKRIVHTAPVAPVTPAQREPGTSSAVRGAVQAYGDLPPAIRNALPPLVVAGFAAGESGGVMVMVDDKLVREGDEVAPGVRVEKILSDSAEFSYKGYRFRR